MPQCSERQPAANLVRSVPAGLGSFGSIAFPFRRATRRVDETVLVEVLDLHHPSALVKLFEAAVEHGVAQLCLGSTICRARAVDWEPEVRCLVFELHRHEETFTEGLPAYARPSDVRSLSLVPRRDCG